jgi:non-ribosomal peptide synthetase component F
MAPPPPTVTPRAWPSAARPLGACVGQMATAAALDAHGNQFTKLHLYQFAGVGLDLAALRAAFQALVDRHEALRLAFRPGADGALECVAAPPGAVVATLEALDLRAHAAGDDAARAALRAVARRPFDLARPPLVRLAAARLRAGRTVLLLCRNHCVMDAGSNAPWLRDLAALYNAFAAGGGAADAALPPLRAQYGDFAAWQNEALTPALAAAQLAFWRRQLAGAPELLELPTDLPRPPRCAGLGGEHRFELGAAAYADLRALCARERQSPLRVALAAWALTLRRFSGQADVVVTAPRAVRPPGTEGVLGHFVNLVAVRLRLDDDAPFLSVVKQAGAALKEAAAHGDVPFERVVEAAGRAGGGAYAPVAQASITSWEEAWTAPPALVGVRAEPCDVDVSNGRCVADVALRLRALPGALAFDLVYNAELFLAPTAARMAAAFESILARGVASPLEPVSAELSAAERAEVAALSCGVERPEYLAAPLAHEAFAAAAAAAPDARCLCFEGAWLSYGEVARRVDALAARLADAGVGPGSVVGLLLDRSLELPVAVLAVLAAGGCYLPCDPSYPDDRLQIYLEDGGAALVLAQATLMPRARALAPRGAVVEDVGALLAAPLAAAPPPPRRRASYDDLAYIIFTSGSTGRPKGVAVLHRGLADLLPWMVEQQALTSTDVAMLTGGISFDIHVLQLLSPLYAGAAVVLAKPEGQLDPAYIAALIVEHAVTAMMCTVPTLVRFSDIFCCLCASLLHILPKTAAFRLPVSPAPGTCLLGAAQRRRAHALPAPSRVGPRRRGRAGRRRAPHAGCLPQAPRPNQHVRPD